jgi:hypothetical protein
MIVAIIFLCCNRHIQSEGIKNNSFKGYALAFYYLPVTGAGIEVIIIPLRIDTVKLKKNLKNFSIENIYQNEIMTGVDITTYLSYSLFDKISSGAEKIKLSNRKDLAFELQSIHVCLVYIDINDIHNDNKYIFKDGQEIVKNELEFENNKHLVLQYFVSQEFKINSLKVPINGASISDVVYP